MAYSSVYAVPATNLLQTAILVNLDKSSSTQIQSLGDTVRARDGREFLHVYYESSAVVVSAGMPAVWVDGAGLSTYTVTSDVSDAGGSLAAGVGKGFAGVFCSNLASDDKAYLWIQTKGVVKGAIVGSIAVNDSLIASTTDKFEAVDTVQSNVSHKPAVIVAFAITADVLNTNSDSSADIVLV